MLVAGDNDNLLPERDLKQHHPGGPRDPAVSSGQGRVLAGHQAQPSQERPNLFAKELLYFLANLGAGDSPYGIAEIMP